MVGNITAETIGTIGTSGSDDGWNGYLTVHSDYQTLDEGSTIHYEFTQRSHGSDNWKGWILVVGDNNIIGKTSWDLNAAAFRLIRHDNWEDKENNGSRCSNDYNWANFAANMDGASVDMYVTLMNGNFKMTSIVKDKNGSHYYYNYVQPTTEKSFLVGLSVNCAQLNISKTETLNGAYLVSKATLDHTASTYLTIVMMIFGIVIMLRKSIIGIFMIIQVHLLEKVSLLHSLAIV
jgi:hypothetical protein